MLDIPKPGGESYFFERQGELDQVLIRLALELKAWNDMLRERFYGAKTAPDYSIPELKEMAVTQLDSLWPYMGHVINVTGAMHDTDIQIAENSTVLGTNLNRKEVAGAFRSNGFGVVEIDKDLPPVVCLSFITGSARFSLAGASAYVTTVGYVRPEEASLIIGEKSADQQEVSSLSGIINTYNERIRKNIYKNKTPFMSLEHDKQVLMMAQVEEEATRELLMDGYDIKVNARSVPYVYTASEIDEEFVRIDSTRFEGITGSVIGACILESLIKPKSAIRSSRDFIDTRAGLCLIVDAGEGRFDKSVVLMPTAEASDLQFSL